MGVRWASDQNLFVAEVVWPTIRIQHGAVEPLVGQVKPGATLVVEVGEG